MRPKYYFTPATFDKDRYEHFMGLIEEFGKIERLTPWEEIKEGEVYHIPNLLAYKRCDFIINEKRLNFIRGKIKEDGCDEWKDYSLFKCETRAKFLVKKIITF